MAQLGLQSSMAATFGILVALDVVLLTAWTLLDPLERHLHLNSNNTPDPVTDQVTVTETESCDCDNFWLWLGMFLGWKGLLLVLGALLAFQTRNVQIAALNDSKSVATAINNVFFVCLMLVPVALSTKHEPTIGYVITSVAIVLATMTTLALLFGSPMLLLMRGDENEIRQFMSTVQSHVTSDGSSVKGKYEPSNSARSAPQGRISRTQSHVGSSSAPPVISLAARRTSQVYPAPSRRESNASSAAQ